MTYSVDFDYGYRIVHSWQDSPHVPLVGDVIMWDGPEGISDSGVVIRREWVGPRTVACVLGDAPPRDEDD